MSVYESNNNAAATQEELHLYGSSRLGMQTKQSAPPQPISLAGNFGMGLLSTFTRGEKLFELSNHLGNVLVTISDKKVAVPQASPNQTLIDYYTADVVTANDYYPGGMTMPGRIYQAGSSSYRYGFNGKERDLETTSTTTYDYGFRIYSPALGRFLSVDPLAKQFAFFTPYQFASNSPISSVDLDGKESLWFQLDMMQKQLDIRAALDPASTDQADYKFGRFLLGMAKSATAEGFVYSLVQNYEQRQAIAEYGTAEQKLALIQKDIGNIGKSGEAQLIEGVCETAKAAWQGDWEARGNIAGMLLSWRAFKAAGESNLAKESTLETPQPEIPNADFRYLALSENTVNYGKATISILEGKGEIVIENKMFKGSFVEGNQTVLIEGNIEVNGKNIDFKNIAVYGETDFNTTAAQGSAGFMNFRNLIKDFSKMAKDAGYEGGTMQFYRSRPEGSPLPDSPPRSVPLDLKNE